MWRSPHGHCVRPSKRSIRFTKIVPRSPILTAKTSPHVPSASHGALFHPTARIRIPCRPTGTTHPRNRPQISPAPHCPSHSPAPHRKSSLPCRPHGACDHPTAPQRKSPLHCTPRPFIPSPQTSPRCHPPSPPRRILGATAPVASSTQPRMGGYNKAFHPISDYERQYLVAQNDLSVL
jgi:hypothetical protein